MIRIFDILFSILAIIILIPLLFPLMIILKFSGEGEIFYKQERIGLNHSKFKVIKFATMLKNSPNLLTGTVTIKNDPRILPLGSFLRSSKINELPQLFNILIGDMSFVGPRPQTEDTVRLLNESVKVKILSNRPGLSGIGSIVFRNEEKMLSGMENLKKFHNDVITPYKGSLEFWYADNTNLLNYFKIIFCTILVVFFPKINIVSKMFKGLPEPPNEIKKYLSL